MQVSVGHDDEPDILGMGVPTGLLLADKRVVLFGLGLQDRQRKSSAVQKQIIHETVGGFLEVVAKGVEGLFLEFDGGFQDDIGRTVRIVKETPSRFFQEAVDTDACFCFFHDIRIHVISGFYTESLPSLILSSQLHRMRQG